MSRRQIISMGASLLVALPSHLLAGFAVQEWKYFKPLRADTTAPYSRTVLDRETLNHARSDLADLRIMDSAGQEVPYQLIRGDEWRTVEQCRARVLNVSHAPGRYSVVMLDLGKSGRTHNTVDLDVTSHNYRRNVHVFGSDDYQQWFVLRNDAAVFDFSTPDDSIRVNRIRYPSSIYRYIKLHVINGNELPLEIHNATLISESDPARILYTFDATATSVRQDAEQKQTILLIDGGLSNVPLAGVALQTEEKNFYRTVQIFAGNDTARMTHVGRDVIYCYDTPRFSDERLMIDFKPFQARYLRLIVHNHDDRPVPLKVQHVIALEYFLIVRGISSGLRLFFGNPTALAPRYDISQTLQYIDVQTAPLASLGQMTANPQYAPEDNRPWTERHPLLLWLTFVVVFIVLGVLVFHMTRKGDPFRSGT